MKEKRIFIRRIWMSVAGVVLTALAVAMFKTAALGVDPFQSFVIGVPCYVLSCGTKGLGTVVGLATIVTAFGMGPFIDWFNRKMVEPFFYRDHERPVK